MATALAEQALDRLTAWKNDPVKFVHEALGLDGVYPNPNSIAPWQAEALQALAVGDRVSIRSGHGVGKSTLLAWIILWWLLTRHNAKIPCVAPTQHQLDDVIWTEVRIWRRKLPKEFQDLLLISKDRIALEEAPQESFAVARTARRENPEARQGFHSGNLLFLFDEASGIDDLIFEVGRGALSTPGAKVVMTGNPTRIQGYFYDSFHKNRKRWKTLKVSTEDLEEAPYVDLEFAREIEEEFGRDSNVYRVRVLGEFPTEEENSVIPLHLIESAVGRRVEPTGKIVWGLDVARFGEDRTALCKRWGNKVLEFKWWHGKDNMQVAGLIQREYEDTKEVRRPDRILVDSIGYGAGVVDIIKSEGLPARGVNVAESAAVNERYMRLRDELWFRGRDWFADRDSDFPDDAIAIGELSTVLYDITGTGKFKVESKDERKKRLVGRTEGHKSPDLADSFILTFAVSTRAKKKARQAERRKLRFREFV